LFARTWFGRRTRGRAIRKTKSVPEPRGIGMNADARTRHTRKHREDALLFPIPKGCHRLCGSLASVGHRRGSNRGGRRGGGLTLRFDDPGISPLRVVCKGIRNPPSPPIAICAREPDGQKRGALVRTVPHSREGDQADAHSKGALPLDLCREEQGGRSVTGRTQEDFKSGRNRKTVEGQRPRPDLQPARRACWEGVQGFG